MLDWYLQIYLHKEKVIGRMRMPFTTSHVNFHRSCICVVGMKPNNFFFLLPLQLTVCGERWSTGIIGGSCEDHHWHKRRSWIWRIRHWGDYFQHWWDFRSLFDFSGNCKFLYSGCRDCWLRLNFMLATGAKPSSNLFSRSVNNKHTDYWLEHPILLVSETVSSQ